MISDHLDLSDNITGSLANAHPEIKFRKLNLDTLFKGKKINVMWNEVKTSFNSLDINRPSILRGTNKMAAKYC